MDTYLYVAKDLLTDKKVKGELEGSSEDSIRKTLMSKNLYVQSIKKKNAFNGDLEIFKPKVKMTDINFFSKQFGAMIQAGISIAKSLEICAEQCPNKTLTGHLNHIHESVNEGKTLSEAVKEENVFPDILVNLMACGEASGNLDEVMNKAVEHFDTQLGIRKKVKKALAYPAIVMVLIVILVVVLMIMVVPAFTELLTSTGAEMPLPTKIVIACSDFFVAQWGILLGVLIVIIAVCFNIRKIPSMNKAIDKLSLKLPIFGDLNRKNLSAIFSSTMSMLVQSGIPMLQAMEITKKVMENAQAEEEMDKAINALKEGSSLLNAIKGSVIFPPILMSMVSIGEESGALDEMLVKISVFFREEVEIAVETMTMLIEPAMIIVIGVVVGGIMLAVMLPTFSAATAVM